MNSQEAYEPSLHVTGVSFRTLDIAGREKLVACGDIPSKVVNELIRAGVAREAALLATCNRFEIISAGGDASGITSFFERTFNVASGVHTPLYQHQDRAAVKHLYQVSSSLDSMVVGEAQILGQVKQAYRQAVDAGSIGRNLHYLFQSAFRVAKRVRSQTDVGNYGLSLSYIAVKLAEQIFADLSKTTVVVLGSGEMAELATLHLCAHGCRNIIVANRTVERAASLARRFGGLAVALDDVQAVLGEADIVIGSLAIDKPIITKQALRYRGVQRPLFLIDLGVPRNIAEDVCQLESTYLYNIDDLVAVAKEHQTLREEAAKEASIVIDYGLLQFERWRAKVANQPDTVDLRALVERICQEEVASRLPSDILDNQEQVTHALAHGLSQKLSHELVSRLRRQTEEGLRQDEEEAPFLIVPWNEDL